MNEKKLTINEYEALLFKEGLSLGEVVGVINNLKNKRVL